MRVFILGNSNVARKRFIPAAERVGVTIAPSISTADAVYISTPPSTHYEYTLQMLDFGKHVLCEKPLFYRHEQCDMAYGSALANDLVLMESWPFTYHKQWNYLQGRVQTLGNMPFHAHMDFGAPMLPTLWREQSNNLGALGDFGVYAVTSASLLGQTGIEDVKMIANKDRDVVISASGVLKMGYGSTLSFDVGYGLDFRSKLSVWNSEWYMVVDKIFNPRFDDTVYIREGSRIQYAYSDDAWGNMIRDFENKVEGRSDRDDELDGYRMIVGTNTLERMIELCEFAS